MNYSAAHLYSKASTLYQASNAIWPFFVMIGLVTGYAGGSAVDKAADNPILTIVVGLGPIFASIFASIILVSYLHVRALQAMQLAEKDMSTEASSRSMLNLSLLAE